MAKPLDALSLAAFESIREVLSSHGYCITREADTQHPLLGEAFNAVLREAARNTTQAIIAVQDEQAHCTHELVEVLSINGRNLDGARRVCATCGATVGHLSTRAA